MPKKLNTKKAKRATSTSSRAKPPTKVRRIHTFLKPSTDQKEWLLSDEESRDIVKSIFDSLSIDPKSKILVPGVGLSALTRQIYNAGFTNLTIVDIEEEAMVEQRRLFSDVDLANSDVKLVRLDIMNEPDALIDTSFDVILDKGCIDVFTRQAGAREFMKIYDAKLKPEGIFICFSMFHRKWKNLNILPRKIWHTMYLNIPQTRYSRTRPSVVRSTENIALFVSTRISDQAVDLAKIVNLSFQNFAQVHRDNFPLNEASDY